MLARNIATAAAVRIAVYEFCLKAASDFVMSASDPNAQSRTVPTFLPVLSVTSADTMSSAEDGTGFCFASCDILPEAARFAAVSSYTRASLASSICMLMSGYAEIEVFAYSMTLEVQRSPPLSYCVPRVSAVCWARRCMFCRV